MNRKTRNGDRPVVMLHADVDALHLEEVSSLMYASTIGATESAGDHAHVTWLPVAAAHLACPVMRQPSR